MAPVRRDGVLGKMAALNTFGTFELFYLTREFLSDAGMKYCRSSATLRRSEN
jgi:hypothetical protein